MRKNSNYMAIFRLAGERSERRVYAKTQSEIDQRVSRLAEQDVLNPGMTIPVYRIKDGALRYTFDITA